MEFSAVDTWESQVRDYEIDFQGVVNNAHYYHYLDNARSLFLTKHNINLREYAEKGINIVLLSSELSYKKSLKFNDSFIVETQLFPHKRISFCFRQVIYHCGGSIRTISVLATSYICAIKNNKPCRLQELQDIIIKQ